MALTYAQAAKIAPDQFLAGICKEVVSVNDLLKMLPWYRVSGRSHTYIRESGAVTAHFVDVGGAVAESAETFKEVTARLRVVADDVDVPGHVLRCMQGSMNQVTAQIGAKTRALGKLLAAKMITGSHPTATIDSAGAITGVAVNATYGAGANSKEGVGTIFLDYTGATNIKLKYRAPGDTDFGALSATVHTGDPTVTLTSADLTQTLTLDVTSSSLNSADATSDVTISTSSYEFDGLKRLIPSGQKISSGTDGAVLAFDHLRQLRDAVTVTDGQPAYIMSLRDRRLLEQLYTAMGGAQPQYGALPQFGMGPTLMFDGIPVLAADTDAISITETQGSSTSKCSHIYLVVLGTPNGVAGEEAPYRGVGLCGLYGGGGESAMVDGKTVNGLFFEDVGVVQGYDSHRYRVGADCSLALYSEHAAAAIYGIRAV